MTLLKDIVQIEKGRKYNLLEENQEGAIRVFQANDFRNENKPLYTLDADGVLAQEDDIMLVWDGSVGQMGFGRSGYVGSTMVKLKVKNKKQFSPFFIYRFLQTKSEYLKRKATGATIMHINRKSLEQLEIPDLEIEDQLHIANLLSKAENLIVQRKESIRLLDEFLKSTFLDMFGDPVRNEKGFEIRNLTEFYINPKEGTKCGPFGSALKKDEFKETGIAVWTMENILKSGEFVEDSCLFISDEKFQELRRYDARNNDIIISRAGTVGKMCIVKTDKENSIISSNLIRLRLGKYLLPIYFFSLMKYCQTRVIKLKHGNEDAYTHMSTGILDKINFPYPPIELQTQFAQIVEKIEALKTQYQQSLQELENLYGSLSQKAFRGELVSKKKEAKKVTLTPETKLVQPELNKQKAFLRKLMLASHIIHELCDEPTFGHTKLMKLLYLSEQAGGMALQTNYKKFAAGPFDGKTLTLIDQEFAKNKWFVIEKKTFSINGQQREATVYRKTDKSLLYKKHFDNYFESETDTINRIIELFRKEKTQTTEIVATLYFAWKELIIANTMISKNSLVKSFYQFHKEKKKFTEEQILLGYEYMLKNELYPQ